MVRRGNQKTKTVRFNLSKQDELRMFEELESHDRKVPDDPYGSAGAYIKAALREYMSGREEREMNQKHYHEIAGIVGQTVSIARETFLEDLEKHDEQLAEALLRIMWMYNNCGEGVQPSVGTGDIEKDRKNWTVNTRGNESDSLPEKTVDQVVKELGEAPDTEMPAEAMDFLKSFGK